jgi:predicted hotdog family 3-hydroxylacyl-ACP dehydratase
VSVTVDLPGDSPYVWGHFPGRPILPGVAQLALALDTLRPALPERLVLARFRRIVTPPARLTFSRRETAAGTVRIDVTSDEHPVSSIEIAPGAPGPVDDWAVAVASRRRSGLPPIEALIPHRDPMLFVESIAGEADDGITCSARIPETCALVRGGVAPAIVAIEAAAQAAAVFEALRAGPGDGNARMGFLVSARDVALHALTVEAGVPLFASARVVAQAGSLAHYQVEVSQESHPLLRGTIGAYLEEAALSGQSSRKQNH